MYLVLLGTRLDIAYTVNTVKLHSSQILQVIHQEVARTGTKLDQEECWNISPPSTYWELSMDFDY